MLQEILGGIGLASNILGGLTGSSSYEKNLADKAAREAKLANTSRYNTATSIYDTALTTLGRDYYSEESSPLAQSIAQKQSELASLKSQAGSMSSAITKQTSSPLGKFWFNLTSGKHQTRDLADINAQIAKLEAEIPQLQEQNKNIYASPEANAGALARIEKTKTRDVSAGMGSLVSSGLANTEAAANLGAAWESSVGSPMRASLEDQQTQAWLQTMMAKAGMITDVTDQYPDYQTLAASSQTAAANPWANVSNIISSVGDYADKYNLFGGTKTTGGLKKLQEV
jgi:hypothetical protein